MAFDPKAYAVANSVKPGGFDPSAYARGMARRQANPELNPRTGMLAREYPIEHTSDVQAAPGFVPDADSPSAQMDMGLAAMTPEQRRERHSEMAATGAGTAAALALGPLLGAGAGAGLLARTAGSILTAAGSGEAAGATRAAVQGKSGSEIADQAAEEGAWGGLVGGGAHLLGEGAAAVAPYLRSGKDWVAKFLKAKDAGVYETPEMQMLPGGTEGIQEAATQSHGRIVKRGMAMDAEAADKYKTDVNGADYTPGAPEVAPPGPAPRQLGPMPSVKDRLLEAMPPRASYDVTPGGRVRPTSPAGEASVPRDGPGASVDQRSLPPPRGPFRPGGALDRATAPSPPPGEPLIPQSTALKPLPGRLNRPANMFESGDELGQARPVTPDASYEPPTVDAEYPQTHEATARASSDYTKPAVAAPKGGRPIATGVKAPVDRGSVLGDLEMGRRGNINPDTGAPAIPGVDAEFQRAVEAMGPEGTANTVEGMLKLRRALKVKANFANTAPTAEELAARHVYQTFRQAIRNASPEIAAADDAFAASARKAGRREDIMHGSEDPAAQPATPETPHEPSDLIDAPAEPVDPKIRVAKEDAGIRKLKRIGDTNEPGLFAKKHLQELGAQDDEFASALKFIEDKKAYEATRLAKPPLPTSFSEAFMWPLRLAHQSGRAALAQGLDPAAQAVGNLRLAAPFSGAVANPLFAAQQAATDRRKRRAETLQRGGHE